MAFGTLAVMAASAITVNPAAMARCADVRLGDCRSRTVLHRRHTWRKAVLVFWTLSHAFPLWASDQPVAYSHKQHIALGLQCLDCHSSADTGAAATLPSLHKCMLCHAKVAAARPEVQKLAAYYAKRREVPWNRVYGFDREALVKFPHAPHFRARIACSRCHGDMSQATTAEPLVKHTMGTCLSCHRQNKASEDCAACHY